MAFKFHAARQVSGAQWTVNRWNAFNCAISVIILWFCACQSEKWTDGWHVSRLTRWQRDGASGYRQPSNGPTDSNQLIDQWQPKSRPSNSALDKRNKLWLQHLSSRRLIFYFQKNLLIWIFSIKCDASAIFRANVSPGQWKKNHTHVTSSGRKWTLTLSADEISIRCQSLYLQEEGKIQSDSGDRCKQRDRIRSLSIKRRVFQKGLEGFQS